MKHQEGSGRYAKVTPFVPSRKELKCIQVSFRFSNDYFPRGEGLVRDGTALDARDPEAGLE